MEESIQAECDRLKPVKIMDSSYNGGPLSYDEVIDQARDNFKGTHVYENICKSNICRVTYNDNDTYRVTFYLPESSPIDLLFIADVTKIKQKSATYKSIW